MENTNEHCAVQSKYWPLKTATCTGSINYTDGFGTTKTALLKNEVPQAYTSAIDNPNVDPPVVNGNFYWVI